MKHTNTLVPEESDTPSIKYEKNPLRDLHVLLLSWRGDLGPGLDTEASEPQVLAAVFHSGESNRPPLSVYPCVHTCS